MPNGISNFQYVYYLSDFLRIYDTIRKLRETFEDQEIKLTQANNKLQARSSAMSLSACLIGWLILFIGAMFSFPILFTGAINGWLWLGLCTGIPCVIIFACKILYTKNVYPVYKNRLEGKIEKIRLDGQKMYRDIAKQKEALQAMKLGMDERCAYPLSLYIMREAAKNGECSNIPQGVHYFTARYETLSTTQDSNLKMLKQNIDNEQSRAEELQAFLDALDERAAVFFS